jgi:hypothetical protein
MRWPAWAATSPARIASSWPATIWSGKVPWRIDLEDWRNLAEPGRTPLYAAGTLEVTWLDEDGPCRVQHLHRVTTNVAIGEW